MLPKNLNNLSMTAVMFSLLLFCMAFFTQTALAVGVCLNVTINGGTLVPVGTSPRSIVSGDIDDDGDLDLAVANTANFSSSPTTVSILLNDGAGNYTPGTTLTPNFPAQTVAFADFNSDGVLDLAAGGGSGSSSGFAGIAVFYGIGNGNFNFPLPVNTNSNSITSLAAADLNRDGLPDIVAATGNNTVLTLVNVGSDFLLTGTNSVGSSPRAVTVADFNADGILDAVVVNSNNNNISVLYGQGNGTFSVANNLPLTTGNTSSFAPTTVAVGDLNNDNRPDLVVGGSSSSLSIFLNTATGRFADPVLFNTQLNSSNIQAILLGKFLGGINLDIAVVSSNSFSDDPNRVTIFSGNGNGGFDSRVMAILPTGSFPAAATAADFNRDGRLDIATANSNSNNVSILLSNSTGGFGPRQMSLTAFPISLVSGDFNGDGFIDSIIGSNSVVSGNTQSNLTLNLNDGTGNFPVQQNITVSNNTNAQLLAADINNDSKFDLIAYGQSNFSGINNAYVYLNNGTATPFNNVTPAAYTFSGTPQSIALGDFNRDGRPELVAALSNNNSISFLLGAANGTFSPGQINFAVANIPSAVAVGDFNNDNFQDIVAAGSSSTGSGGSNVTILLGNSSGGFVQSGTPVSVASSVVGINTADFNGDGRLDAAVLSNGSFSGSTGSVSVLLGTGDGRLGNPVTYNVGIAPRNIRIGDFNGDSRPDIAMANRNSNTVSLLINNGGGAFSQNLNYLSGVFPNAIDIGDFNRDGKTDILAANQFGGVLPGLGAAAGGTATLLNNTCKEAITKTDYTGDGRTDFTVFRPSNGTWYITNDGANFSQQQFGANGDIPVQADYDGDGETDFAVFRPSNSTWYILRSGTNRSRAVNWGAAGDIPVPGDYDGDGRADIAVFRPSNGTWYILPSLTPAQFLALRWGTNGDVPVQADYDGDGKTDLAVFRAGTWFILNSSNNNIRVQQFGLASDTPVLGDYDGDGKSDLAVFRAGNWYFLLSATNLFRAENFGISTDRPQPGDYDGDGRTDLAVYRDGAWYVRQSSNNAFRAVIFGNASDFPVAAVYRIQ